MKKIRVATLLATIGKEALQIYRHLPMTEEKRRNPKEIKEKLGGLLETKKNAIYKRYVFVSSDQEANETTYASLASLRRLASSCVFA